MPNAPGLRGPDMQDLLLHLPISTRHDPQPVDECDDNQAMELSGPLFISFFKNVDDATIERKSRVSPFPVTAACH